MLDILMTQTQIRVFVNKAVRKVSGPERKEVIWGSRILHYECMRCEVLTVINIEIQYCGKWLHVVS